MVSRTTLENPWGCPGDFFDSRQFEKRVKRKRDYRKAILQVVRKVDRAEFSSAEKDIDRLRKALPEQPDLYHLKGLCRLAAGDARSAERFIERAITLFPTLPDFHYNLGRTREVLKDSPGAEQCYREVIRLSPGHVSASLQLGELLRHQKRFDDVLAVIVPALEHSPEDYRLHFQAAFAYAHRHDFDAAVRHFGHVISRKPDFPDAHNNLGNSLRRLHRYEEALVAYERALALSNDYIEARHNRAALLLALGRNREAYDALWSLVQAAPYLTSAWGNFAEAALNCGEQQNVTELAQKQLDGQDNPIGPLLALSNLARFHHDYPKVLELIKQHGHKLQQALPTDRYPYLIGLDWVISRWLEGKRDGLKNHLQALINGSSRIDHQLRVTRIFLRMLLRLAEWHEAAAPVAQNEPVLTCIGDSHALTVAGYEFVVAGKHGVVQSLFVMGAKAFHLTQSIENKFKKSLELALDKAPRHLPVLLCFGEIDCRLWEGIIPAWRAGKITDLETAIQQQAFDYVEKLVGLASAKGLTLWFQGIPAPNLDWTNVSDEDRCLLVKVIQTFNSAMKAATTKSGCRFIDAYALTAGVDGTSNQQWHLDSQHLRPDYLQQFAREGADVQVGLIEQVKKACKEGRLEEAKTLLQRETTPRPETAVGWLILGVTFHQAQQLDQAQESYQQAVAIDPTLAAAYNNLGLLLRGRNDLCGALKQFERACELLPTSAEIHRNRGVLLEKLGNPSEAKAALRAAITLQPGNHQIHVRLAQLLRNQGELHEAATHYRDAIRLRPDIAEVHYNLGHIQRDLGMLDEAAACYREAWRLNPEFLEARLSESRALLGAGRIKEALFAAIDALRNSESNKTRALVAGCLGNLALDETYSDNDLATIKHALVRSIAEAWTRPGYLLGVAVKFIRSNPAFQAWQRQTSESAQATNDDVTFGEREWAELYADNLMRVALQAAPLPDVTLEHFLAGLRRTLLHRAVGTECKADSEDALAFYCALARQCFINEYLLPVTQEESAQVEQLRLSVVPAMTKAAPINPRALVALAAYLPLHSLPNAARLVDRQWPSAVINLLVQQVAEPLDERRLQAEVRRLTPVEDTTSARVRQQYEENPYPRWVKPAPPGESVDIDTRLRRSFPVATFKPLGKKAPIDILIAGCGTGQQSVETAQSFPEARVLAIDLSLASLGYAMRKTRELGLTNIEYSQADILQLGGIGRTFDVIDSSGVLHHLSDPEHGWRVLLTLLRPGGFMNIGLYSELARQNVVGAREFIARRGYGHTVEDIRACRQAIITIQGDAPWRSVLRWTDFYSTSACRDLIFHVQEHRFTIPRIKAFLTNNGLAFIGFNIDPRTLARYRKRFLDDPAAVNLDFWDVFEHENPDTFSGMYQFCVQKP